MEGILALALAMAKREIYVLNILRCLCARITAKRWLNKMKVL